MRRTGGRWTRAQAWAAGDGVESMHRGQRWFDCDAWYACPALLRCHDCRVAESDAQLRTRACGYGRHTCLSSLSSLLYAACVLGNLNIVRLINCERAMQVATRPPADVLLHRPHTPPRDTPPPSTSHDPSPIYLAQPQHHDTLLTVAFAPRRSD